MTQKAYTESMNFEDTIPKIPQNQPMSDIEAVSVEARQKAESFIRSGIHPLLESAKEEPDKKRFIIDKITPFGRRVFEGKEDIFNSALEKIEAIPYITDEELEEILVKELGNAVLEFSIRSGFSEHEAKIYFRRFSEERDEKTPLDTDWVLSYTRYEEKIDLHITEGFTIQLFQEDMSRLAEVVRADESIKTIKMTSWVVEKHKNAIRKLGFTIGEPLSEAVQAEMRVDLPPEMRDKPRAEAYMTREDFLARYGVEK